MACMVEEVGIIFHPVPWVEQSRPPEACLPVACLLHPFLIFFFFYPFPFHFCLYLLCLPLPYTQIPAVVTHHVPPVMVHPTAARPAVTSPGLCPCWLTGCLPVAEHSDSQLGSAFPGWEYKRVSFLPVWLLVSATSCETPSPLPNKIETGQWIQKSARVVGIGFRDPINFVFVGNHFGKAAGLKATDYGIEKCTLFSVIQDWIK